MRQENPHKFRPEDRTREPKGYKDRRTGEQFREKKYRIKKYGSIVLWSESSPVLLSLFGPLVLWSYRYFPRLTLRMSPEARNSVWNASEASRVWGV